jgi:hypothetical protein
VTRWPRFTGAGSIKASFSVDVEVEQGHRLTTAEKLVAGGDEEVRVTGDSTAFSIEVRPQLQIVLFDTKPGPARVKFTVRGSSDGVADVVYTGRRETAPLGKQFVLDTDQAFGTPETFESNRGSGVPGVYVWWLPGEEATKVREATKLTPEEIKRLKALGYIQ